MDQWLNSRCARNFSRQPSPLHHRSRRSRGATLLAVRLWAAKLRRTTFKQGDFEITVLSDGHLVLPSNLLGADAPPEERKAFLEAHRAPAKNISRPTSPARSAPAPT